MDDRDLEVLLAERLCVALEGIEIQLKRIADELEENQGQRDMLKADDNRDP